MHGTGANEVEGESSRGAGYRAREHGISSLAGALWHLMSVRARARSLAAVRIGLGGAGLLVALETAPRLLVMSDPRRLRHPAIEALGDGALAIELAWAVIAAWVLSSSAFLVGWHTRVAGALLGFLIASVLALDLQLYSNHLYLLGLLVVLTSLGDGGAARSLDARRRGERSVPRWPIVLVKAQVSLVYGFAALSKLNGAFLSGGILAGVSGEGLLPIPQGLVRFEAMFPLAVAAVATEGFLSFGLWLPRTRRLAIGWGIAFHIAVTLWLAPTLEFLAFGLTIVPTYFLFAEPESRSGNPWHHEGNTGRRPARPATDAYAPESARTSSCRKQETRWSFTSPAACM